MTVDLNANIAEPEGTLRGDAIADELATAGLDNMGLNFLPWRKPWLQDRCKWTMRQDGKEVRSQMDYILRTDLRLFQEVAV